MFSCSDLVVEVRDLNFRSHIFGEPEAVANFIE